MAKSGEEVIESRYILDICEEWVKKVKTGKSQADIYENPGSTDIKELNLSVKARSASVERSIRYLADGASKKVYAWDAWKATHSQVLVSLGLGQNERLSESSHILSGFGNLSGGRIVSFPDKYEGSVVAVEMNLVTALEQESMTISMIKSNPHSDGVKNFFSYTHWAVPIFSGILRYNWSFVDRYIAGEGIRINSILAKCRDCLKRMNDLKEIYK